MKSWRYDVGERPNKVTALERSDRGNRIYLRWRRDGNWKHACLGVSLRHKNGRVDRTVEAWVKKEVWVKHHELFCRGEVAGTDLTIADTVRLITSPDGPYPRDTHTRQEAVNALHDAVRKLGSGKKWCEVTRQDIRNLGRERINQLRAKGHVGLRGAEITLQRFLTTARWLREEAQLVSTTACLPNPRWKEHLRDDWLSLTGEEFNPEPNRPRYTAEEVVRIVRAAALVDPRLELLMVLGAELRLGQVARATRSDLDLERGVFVVRSASRRKRGTSVKLSGGQLEKVNQVLSAGYLSYLEGRYADFRLFPGGQLAGGRKGRGVAVDRHVDGPIVSRQQRDRWFKLAESVAGIEHMAGRGAYGIRRVAVDLAKREGISDAALKNLGGWSDVTTPNRVYADPEPTFAMEEAEKIRGRLRGYE